VVRDGVKMSFSDPVTRQIDVGDVSYFVRMSGRFGAKRPLLLLHGFTGGSENWEPLFPDLALTRPLIAVDLLGHGRTSVPSAPERYGMMYAAADLAQLLGMLGVAQVDVLGYSMGGRLSLYFALNFPQVVHSLILESSSPGLATAPERTERQVRDNKLAERIERDGIELFVDFWESLGLWDSQKGLDDGVRLRLRRQRLRNRPLGLAHSLRGMGTGVQPNLWPRLTELSIPVALLTGELDRKFVGIAQKMLPLLPNGSHRVIQGAGHTVHLERPTAWATAVNQLLTAVDTIP